MERFDFCECGNALTVGTFEAQNCGECKTIEDAEYWADRTKLLIKRRDDEIRRKTIERERWLTGRRF